MLISDLSSDVCSSDLTYRGKAKIFETIPNLSGAHFTIRIIIENVAPTGCESEIVGKPVRNFGIDENFGSAGLIVGKIGTKIGPLAIIACGGCEADPITLIVEIDAAFPVGDKIFKFQQPLALTGNQRPGPGDLIFRSEEHTSELQSLMTTSYAVSR